MRDDKNLTTDVLVIGCGIGGASAALEAAKRGLKVVVITKHAKPEESNTFYAQGGIVTLGVGDDPGRLKADILKAGDRLAPQEVERLLTDLQRTDNPYICPHGQPIIVGISHHELDKKFERV